MSKSIFTPVSDAILCYNSPLLPWGDANVTDPRAVGLKRSRPEFLIYLLDAGLDPYLFCGRDRGSLLCHLLRDGAKGINAKKTSGRIISLFLVQNKLFKCFYILEWSRDKRFQNLKTLKCLRELNSHIVFLKQDKV